MIKINLSLDRNQLGALSEIVADAGQVFFAATVVPFLFGIDKINISMLLSGLALTVACWIASVVIAKGGRK